MFAWISAACPFVGEDLGPLKQGPDTYVSRHTEIGHNLPGQRIHDPGPDHRPSRFRKGASCRLPYRSVPRHQCKATLHTSAMESNKPRPPFACLSSAQRLSSGPAISESRREVTVLGMGTHVEAAPQRASSTQASLTHAETTRQSVKRTATAPTGRALDMRRPIHPGVGE